MGKMGINRLQYQQHDHEAGLGVLTAVRLMHQPAVVVEGEARRIMTISYGLMFTDWMDASRALFHVAAGGRQAAGLPDPCELISAQLDGIVDQEGCGGVGVREGRWQPMQAGRGPEWSPAALSNMGVPTCSLMQPHCDASC